MAIHLDFTQIPDGRTLRLRDDRLPEALPEDCGVRHSCCFEFCDSCAHDACAYDSCSPRCGGGAPRDPCGDRLNALHGAYHACACVLYGGIHHCYGAGDQVFFCGDHLNDDAALHVAYHVCARDACDAYVCSPHYCGADAQAGLCGDHLSDDAALHDAYRVCACVPCVDTLHCGGVGAQVALCEDHPNDDAALHGACVPYPCGGAWQNVPCQAGQSVCVFGFAQFFSPLALHLTVVLRVRILRFLESVWGQCDYAAIHDRADPHVRILGASRAACRSSGSVPWNDARAV